MKSVALFVLLTCLVAGSHANGTGGFFLVFTFDGGQLREPAIMAVTAYEDRALRQSSAWTLRVLDAQGGELHRTALGDPFAYTPSDGSSARQLVARVPDAPGAAVLQLIDASGAVVWKRGIDDGLRAAASAKADAVRASMARDAKAAPSIRFDGGGQAAAAVHRQRRKAAALSVLRSDASDESAGPARRKAAMERLQALELDELLPGGPAYLPDDMHGHVDSPPPVAGRPEVGPHPLPALPVQGPMREAPADSLAAVPLSGRVTTASGDAPGTPMLGHLYAGDNHARVVPIDSAGRFEILAEPDREYRLWLQAPAPFLSAWHRLDTGERARAAAVLPTLKLDEGVILRVRPKGPSGESLMTPDRGGWVYVGHEFHGSIGFSALTQAWEIAVPRQAEVIINFHTDGTYFNPAIGPRRFDAATTLEPVFHPIRRLSGVVRRSDGTAHTNATIRAYDRDSGAYIVSTRSVAGGAYEMLLRPGSYDIELDGRHNQSSVNLMYAAPVRLDAVTVGAGDVQRDLTLTLPGRSLTVDVVGRPPLLAPQVTVRQGGTVLSRTFAHGGTGECTADECRRSIELLFDPGVYDIDFDIVNGSGRHTTTYHALDLRTSDHAFDFDVRAEKSLWHGRLLDADGQPVAFGYAWAFDRTGISRDFIYADENGDFTISAALGWTIELGVPVEGLTVRRRIKVDSIDDLPDAVRLDALPPPVLSDSGGLHRIFTGAAPDAARILFLGDGYTTVRETFTDSNGNGVWDGVLWHDLDGNGVLDAGEPHAVYGDAPVPAVGSTPGGDDEPFEDLNGDGYLSGNDEALFVLSATTHMRAFLGADYWEGHRGAFDARAAFLESAQAGGDIVDVMGNAILARDTRLGGGVELERRTLIADREAAMLLAEQLWPGFDYLIVMLNHPVPFGRANTTMGGIPGSMLIAGGALVQYPNSQTMGHEAGHFFGLLADEYFEFPSTSDGWEPVAANVTTRTKREEIKWRRWLDPEQSLPSPTVFPDDRIGLYEGGFYQQGGVYRASWNSIMRSGFWFDDSQQASLDAGLARFSILPPSLNQYGLTGNWYEPATSGQGFTLQVYEDEGGPGKGLLFGGWFTFDTVAGGEERQRWYMISGEVDSRAQSAPLSIHANHGGNFDAPPTTDAQALGTALFSVVDCGRARLEYAFDDGRTGSIELFRIMANVACVTRGAGLPEPDPAYALSGNWYEPQTSGQGLMIEVNPITPHMFATWFTYAPDGEQVGGPASQRWFAFQAPLGADFRSYADFDIYLRRGGVFDSAHETEAVVVGKGGLVFHSCTRATLTYAFDAGENAGRSGTIELDRLGGPMPGCVD